MPTTTDPAQKLGAVAAAIAQALSGVPGLTVHDHEPVGRPVALPCLYVGAVRLSRPGVEEEQRQLGSDDWLQSWSLTLQAALDPPEVQFAAVRALIGQIADAIDDDPTLGGEAQIGAAVVDADQGLNDESEDPRLIVVEIELEALSLMPRT